MSEEGGVKMYFIGQCIHFHELGIIQSCSTDFSDILTEHKMVD